MFGDPGGIERGRWRIRIGRGGQSVTANAAELPSDDAGLRIDPLLSNGAERVDLVVQGPLGSDLRASFAIVPGLDVQRPARIFCPGDPGVSVGIIADPVVVFTRQRTTGSVQLVAADDSDHVTCTVEGTGGVSIDLRVRVNRLLWGLTRSDDPATILDDQLATVPADQLIDGTVTALVLRTGVEGARVSLRLDNGRNQIQKSEDARTSGADGRWTFDLGRFRDSVRASDEPRLRLLLTVEGRTIPVGDIRASLDVGQIVASSRIHGNFAAVNLEFEEHRALRNRVARLWSLDRPWDTPISEPIADDHTGSAQLGGFDRIVAGRYLAEVAIDDGWILPARPRPGSPNTAQIRVGSGDEWRRRLAALEVDDDPLAVLELATATGVIRRQLEADELSKIAPSALDAACDMIEGDDVGAMTSRQFRAVCDLLLADPMSLVRAVVDGLTEGRQNPTTVLGFCIENIQRVHPFKVGNPDDQLIRSLWLSAPALAAALEIGVDTTPESAARCDEFLGWAPEGGSEVLATGGPVDQVMVGIDADQLQAIQRSMELVPRQLLSLDALVVANFEWLLAEKRGTAKPERWWLHARPLIDGLHVPKGIADRHLNARRPPKGCAAWAALPQATLAAAVHIVTSSTDPISATRALRAAVAFAPRLVTRDLLLAIALVRGHSKEESER